MRSSSEPRSGCRRWPARTSARRCCGAAKTRSQAFRRAGRCQALIEARSGRSERSIHSFQHLVDLIHATADEASALQVVAEDLLTSSGACSVVIRSARLGGVAASAGRGWPARRLCACVLDGADGASAMASRPTRPSPCGPGIGRSGAVAARWVRRAPRSVRRVTGSVRVAAAAVGAVAPRDPVPARSRRDSETHSRIISSDLDHAAERIRERDPPGRDGTVSVLIEGESGSGKELVARAIHARGIRRAPALLRDQLRGADRRSCSKPSSSATRGAPLPARWSSVRGSSKKPIRARCSSTKWASCQPVRRRSCYACARRA